MNHWIKAHHRKEHVTWNLMTLGVITINEASEKFGVPPEMLVEYLESKSRDMLKIDHHDGSVDFIDVTSMNLTPHK